MTQDFFQAFILLTLVTDPFGNVPIFVSALSHVPQERRWRVIVRECAIAFALLMLSCFWQALFNCSATLRSIASDWWRGYSIF